MFESAQRALAPWTGRQAHPSSTDLAGVEMIRPSDHTQIYLAVPSLKAASAPAARAGLFNGVRLLQLRRHAESRPHFALNIQYDCCGAAATRSILPKGSNVTDRGEFGRDPVIS
jgi:hypothetical protein